MRLTQESFLAKAKLKHGDRYDYSDTEYQDSQAKVAIICLIHGKFWQRPASHLMGFGCRPCGRAGALVARYQNNHNVRLNNFLDKAYMVHGNRYGYDKTKYQNKRTKITITCLIHGDFEQAPGHHLEGLGCPRCGVWPSNRDAREQSFINQASIVHDGYYDYSATVYNGARSKVIIVCPAHGQFEQKANSHLCGCGCPKCGHYAFASAVYQDGAPTTLYLVRMRSSKGSWLKIGVTRYSMERRFKGFPVDITLLHEVKAPASKAFYHEQHIINKLAEYSCYPHETIPNGRTECFVDEPQILNLICEEMDTIAK